jgi:peptidoglycan hydrolase-like protein with peptidoglycan-binding domain
MRQSVRRWLAGAGAAAAVGAAVLSQGGVAGAATIAAAGRAAPVHEAAAAAYVPIHHIIYFGDHGTGVLHVQERLRQLHYYVGKADGSFGQNTLEAVWAFKEVQGIKTSSGPNDIGLNMERALVNPRLPKVLKPSGGSNLRVEVNQSIEVLVLYHHNKVELISHVSTGGEYSYCDPNGGCGNIAHTPDGNYRALAFMPGWVKVPLGEMFNPVFFIGRAYAIHGDTSVPLQAASHGCVRIPMDIASFFHKRLNVPGTPIYVKGRV